jgi:hypothetical protein
MKSHEKRKKNWYNRNTAEKFILRRVLHAIYIEDQHVIYDVKRGVLYGNFTGWPHEILLQIPTPLHINPPQTDI